LLKGRNIFMGYLNDRSKTQESFDKDGWFRTGDVGQIDHNGFVYITGRVKDIVITAGGENVPPVLIEDNIKAELPCISDAVLIGNMRKYLTVLLTLSTEVSPETGIPNDELTETAIKWCRKIGSSSNTVSEGIDRANFKAAIKAYKVQKFALLQKGFSIATEEMG
jgi:long-chain-fatty-acid--CoA ligase ACSBG